METREFIKFKNQTEINKTEIKTSDQVIDAPLNSCNIR
jgi:hypothetical protein